MPTGGNPTSPKSDPSRNTLSTQSRSGRGRNNKKIKDETIGLLWDLENIPTINRNKKDK
mgnify:FL=1